MIIDTHKDEALLLSYFQHCLDGVSSDSFLVGYAQEKKVHSFQVVGAGNYIMKHESIFQSEDEDFLRCAKLAYLFHDIGRFEEIELRFNKPTERYDHSILSYEILKNYPQYSRPEILLPVKHHGHMIEALYDDEDYQVLAGSPLQDKVKKIAFLVRDADKIANFYLLHRALEKNDKSILRLFFYDLPPMLPTEKALSQYLSSQMVDINRTNVADTFLNYYSWIYDLNYKSSFDFCLRNGTFNSMRKLTSLYIHDDIIAQKIEKQFLSSISSL